MWHQKKIKTHEDLNLVLLLFILWQELHFLKLLIGYCFKLHLNIKFEPISQILRNSLGTKLGYEIVQINQTKLKIYSYSHVLIKLFKKVN